MFTYYIKCCVPPSHAQTKLVSVAESISSKLSYFTELESVGGRLASSTLSVTSNSFTSTLTKLDHCITFIQHNVRPPVFLVVTHCLHKLLLDCSCL